MTYVLISAANQDTVARASIASIMPFTSVPVLSASPGPVLAQATQASGLAAQGRAGLTHLALRAIAFGDQPPPSMPLGIGRPLALFQETAPCLVSGSMAVTLDDNDDSNTLTAGDALSVLFSQCSDSMGSVVNGGMRMSIATYSETASAANMAGSMVFQSLAMLDDGVTFSLNGGVGFSITASQAVGGITVLSSFTVASGGLTVVDSGSAIGFADTLSYRVGYTVTERDFTSNVQGLPSTEELTANGDFGSLALGGDLRLATVQPIKAAWTAPAGDIFPTQGQLVATGLKNTKVGLTASESILVRMDMCDDGDNVWEGTKMVDWNWLLQ